MPMTYELPSARLHVQASDQHPLYITTSSLGGAGRGLKPMEVILAGGDKSYGTPNQPYTLKWTPNACGPATCAVLAVLAGPRPGAWRSHTDLSLRACRADLLYKTIVKLPDCTSLNRIS